MSALGLVKLQGAGGASSTDLVGRPLGRLGRAVEIASSVLWLCSPRASVVLGVALPVNDEHTAQ